MTNEQIIDILNKLGYDEITINVDKCTYDVFHPKRKIIYTGMDLNKINFNTKAIKFPPLDYNTIKLSCENIFKDSECKFCYLEYNENKPNDTKVFYCAPKRKKPTSIYYRHLVSGGIRINVEWDIEDIYDNVLIKIKDMDGFDIDHVEYNEKETSKTIIHFKHPNRLLTVKNEFRYIMRDNWSLKEPQISLDEINEIGKKFSKEHPKYKYLGCKRFKGSKSILSFVKIDNGKIWNPSYESIVYSNINSDVGGYIANDIKNLYIFKTDSFVGTFICNETKFNFHKNEREFWLDDGEIEIIGQFNERYSFLKGIVDTVNSEIEIDHDLDIVGYTCIRKIHNIEYIQQRCYDLFNL